MMNFVFFEQSKMHRDGDYGDGVEFVAGYWNWTAAVLLLIFTCHLLHRSSCFFFFFSFRRHPHQKSAPPQPCSSTHNSKLSISGVVSDLDLKNLIDILDDSLPESVIWENVIDKSNASFSYKAKSCKPKDGVGPLKYLSVTTFENCSAETLRNFYMDNEYRKLWDKTLIHHEQLQVDPVSGTEIGRTVKKFPFLTPREYVLAWRLWQGKDGSFYCFSKECEHCLSPRQKKYIRISFFRSGWRIRKVPNRNACEIKMVHQEDAGLNIEMAKLAFAKGIWSYICRMDTALRKYSANEHLQSNPISCAFTMIKKVPPEFEGVSKGICELCPENPAASEVCHQGSRECHARELSRSPSNKLIANGLILLGGAICFSRGHSSLGAKVAMVYILSKLRKHCDSSSQSRQKKWNRAL